VRARSCAPLRGALFVGQGGDEGPGPPKQEQNRSPPIFAREFAADRAVPPSDFLLAPPDPVSPTGGVHARTLRRTPVTGREILKLIDKEEERRLLEQGQANAGRRRAKDFRPVVRPYCTDGIRRDLAPIVDRPRGSRPCYRPPRPWRWCSRIKPSAPVITCGDARLGRPPSRARLLVSLHKNVERLCRRDAPPRLDRRLKPKRLPE
jgi:hypothetical protein